MIKKIKKIIKKFGLFKIRNNTIFKLNKDYKIFSHLKNKYKKVLNKDIPYISTEENKTVWFCWLQGLENAPELVQACYDYMCKNLKDYRIIVVTENNFRQYTDIPTFIIDKWKKKIITNTHFSDILRVELLTKNGGIWIDSTVLCTSNLPNYVSGSDFFVFSAEYRNDETSMLSSWFIKSGKNHPILLAAREMLHKYWANNNKLIHYFLFHMFMTMTMEKNAYLIKDMPFITNINPHVLQLKYLFKPLKKEDVKFIKDTCFVHKLSYKFEKELINAEDTNYKAILERKF